MNRTTPYSEWFKSVTGFEPHPWQAELGGMQACTDRLLRIPTGLGKTAGAVLAWLFHRVVRGDEAWPRRLSFCLPMRVLVEQTEDCIRAWLETAGLDGSVGLHVLMGGREAEAWVRTPERAAILLGTQDMLLSRALNRGYAAARGRWPMELGLLHQDTLWVFDEVQLMGVGLATSTQLAAFRRDEARRGRSLRPTRSWWMSATLQPAWLRTVDWECEVAKLDAASLRIPEKERTGGSFHVSKALTRELDATPESVATLVTSRHRLNTLTLVIVNTVDRARAIFEALERSHSEGRGRQARRREDAPDLRLVHSRFRGAERAAWASKAGFLRREAALPAAGRILVATQVVEAGVDLSASLLVTDLAPWSSLVQRFGRAARRPGEEAQVIVLGSAPDKDAEALPYAPAPLAAAIEALASIDQVDPRALEQFEEELASNRPELLQRLHPYAPGHVLRRRDLDQLFDTTPDLTGSDLDIGRFVRSGSERDVRVFWRDLTDEQLRKDGLGRAEVASPDRQELCPVPVGELRKWIKTDKGARRALVWDYVEGRWSVLSPQRLLPGQVVLLPARAGGYDPNRGWDAKSKSPVTTLLSPEVEGAASALTATSEAEEDDSLSVAEWQSIGVHGGEVAAELGHLIGRIGLSSELRRLLDLAARWHDAGKVHEVFQRAIDDEAREAAGGIAKQRDLAKAPSAAWRHARGYCDRAGFRHELVSTLALFEVLRRAAPHHEALLGSHLEGLAACDLAAQPLGDGESIEGAHPLAVELVSRSASELDLVAWLVCTHHGKVRSTWASTRRDQELADPSTGETSIHGVRDGDQLVSFSLMDQAGAEARVPELSLSLDLAAMGLGTRYGASWSERATRLLERHGPFELSYLEALLRAADWRVSERLGREVAP